MKNRTASRITAKALSITLAVVILLSTFPISAVAAGAGAVKYKNTRVIASNLDYVNTVYWNDTYNREESYALVNYSGGDVRPIVMKDDTVYGAVTLSETIAYAQSQGYNVLGGLNAGFFTSTGIPLGLFIENGIYKSSPSGLPAVVFFEDGSMRILDAPDIIMTLTNLGDGIENLNTGKSVSVTNLNKARNENGGMYIFSSAFSTVSTRTSTQGWFVRFEIIEGELTTSGEMRLRVIETFESNGAVPIGEGNLILSAFGAAGEQYASFAPGDEVSLVTTSNSELLATAKWGTGSGDVLIRDGAITDSAMWDKALIDRHPRTAIGARADGTLVAYVLDGRNSNYGNGLPMMALAEELLAQGCVAAVNLDGGGSSIMNVQLPGKNSPETVNRPSDGSARKSSICILFVTDNVSDRAARNLALSNDGAIVLAGSSFELGYVATDSAYRPVGVPADIEAFPTSLASSTPPGEVTGSTYMAGLQGGIIKLALYSLSTGATGAGEVFVLNTPTSITAQSAEGVQLSRISISPGGTVSLAPVATYYRKAVIAQPGSFTYEVTGDIGTITPDGVFTAADRGSGTGSIKISAGTCSITVPVTMQGFSDTAGHWAREFIDELYANGIVTGVTATEYMPENKIRRGDFVLMLYRAAGQPAISGALDAFVDVSDGAYYAQAVTWALEAGITTGVGDNKFDPLSDLTREQAFTFVYRALSLLKIESLPLAESALADFTDADELSEYAVAATEMLITLRIIAGADGKLMPKKQLTRAEMAKILCETLKLQGQTLFPGGVPLETPELPPHVEMPVSEDGDPDNS